MYLCSIKTMLFKRKQLPFFFHLLSISEFVNGSISLRCTTAIFRWAFSPHKFSDILLLSVFSELSTSYTCLWVTLFEIHDQKEGGWELAVFVLDDPIHRFVTSIRIISKVLKFSYYHIFDLQYLSCQQHQRRLQGHVSLMEHLDQCIMMMHSTVTWIALLRSTRVRQFQRLFQWLTIIVLIVILLSVLPSNWWRKVFESNSTRLVEVRTKMLSWRQRACIVVKAIS